jgi:high-affinity K+ transport system ATPase subunit B
MDPVSISSVAAAAVAILSNFFSKATEGAAKKTGEAVFDTIKQKFSANLAQAEVLQDFEHQPANDDLAASVRVHLGKLLVADPKLVQTLSALINAAAPGASTTTVTQKAGDRSTQYGIVHGNVNTEHKR